MRGALLAALLVGTALAENHGDHVNSVVVKVNEALSPETPSRTYAATTTDCDLMKVHISNFRLPTGASVSVCGAAQQGGSRECYSYGDGHGKYTKDAPDGEDGDRSFGAMSVDGTQVTVTLQLPAAVSWDPATHSATVARVVEIGHQESPEGRDAQSLSICGSATNYRDAVCYRTTNPTHYTRGMAVAKLVNGFSSTVCTGWRLTRNNLMMTNEHCIGSQEILNSIEWHFNYQRSTCGGSGNSGTLKVLGGTLLRWSNDADPHLDWSLSSLNYQSYEDVMQWLGPNGERIGWLDISKQEPSVGTRIYIPQHPSGLPKKIAIAEDRPSGFCEVRSMSPAGNADWASFKMGYRCDTKGGSSGSPVIRASDHRVVALHSNAGCTTGSLTNHNKGTKITHIWPLIESYLAVTNFPTQWPGVATWYPQTITNFPTGYPVPSSWPTGFPYSGFPAAVGWASGFPSGFPSGYPSGWPTGYPSGPSGYPTGYPRTGFPSTGFPSTGFPSSGFPSGYPSSGFPSGFPMYPTGFPSKPPTGFPSRYPAYPTGYPSRSPTRYPSWYPHQLQTLGPIRLVTSMPFGIVRTNPPTFPKLTAFPFGISPITLRPGLWIPGKEQKAAGEEGVAQGAKGVTAGLRGAAQ